MKSKTHTSGSHKACLLDKWFQEAGLLHTVGVCGAGSQPFLWDRISLIIPCWWSPLGLSTSGDQEVELPYDWRYPTTVCCKPLIQQWKEEHSSTHHGQDFIQVKTITLAHFSITTDFASANPQKMSPWLWTIGHSLSWSVAIKVSKVERWWLQFSYVLV